MRNWRCCHMAAFFVMSVAGFGFGREVDPADQFKAESLGADWTQDKAGQLEVLIYKYICWESGFDILTRQPVREAALHPDIRRCLVRAEDLQHFIETREFRVPVYEKTADSLNLSQFSIVYWGAKEGFSGFESSQNLAICMTDVYQAGESKCDFNQLPADVNPVLVYNRARKERYIKGCSTLVWGYETALFSRHIAGGWKKHASYPKNITLQVNPRVRSDWPISPSKGVKLPDFVPGELHLPVPYLKMKAQEYRAVFCERQDLKGCIWSKMVEGIKRYSIILRDSSAIYTFMLRVHVSSDPTHQVRCLFGGTLGSRNPATKSRIDFVKTQLEEVYPHCEICIWHPLYSLQRDFSSDTLFALAFMKGGCDGSLDFMMDYFGDVLGGNGKTSDQYPVWLMPVGVQKLMQELDPDYFRIGKGTKIEDYEKTRESFAAFLRHAQEKQYVVTCPTLKKINLECSQKQMWLYNIEVMLQRYIALLDYLKTVRGKAEILNPDNNHVVNRKPGRTVDMEVCPAIKRKCMATSEGGK